MIRKAVVLALALTLLTPTVAAATNGVDALTKCTWTTGRVGQTNEQGGQITYYADDWWNPKTGYYNTVWQRSPFNRPVFSWGDAPHGDWYVGYDPNFGRYSWLQSGSFTVWGTATKAGTTKAAAVASASTAIVSTTTGRGHAWDDWAKCQNGTGWVTINP